MEPKNQTTHLLQSIAQQDTGAIIRLLSSGQDVPELNTPDAAGCSPLMLTLAGRFGRHSPQIIDRMLQLGARITNGPLPEQQKIPKLLTRHANARNIAYICRKYLENRLSPPAQELILEIGSGDGYLKYLLALCQTQETEHLSHMLIETEPSPEQVQAAHTQGRLILQTDVKQLDDFFSSESLAAVFSLNVLDIFSAGELRQAVVQLHRLLKPKSVFLHIMSSAVHKNVFNNISREYPDYIMLPYYKDGFAGVRLIAQEKSQGSQQAPPVNTSPAQLAGLFASHPETYVQLAESITATFHNTEDPGIVLLLKDFSARAITHCLSHNGFKVISCEEAASASLVKQDECHKVFNGFNHFTNLAGTLLTDTDPAIPPGEVLEKSVFIYLLVEKV